MENFDFYSLLQRNSTVGGDEDKDSDPTVVIWTKIGFIIAVTAEAMIAGMFPTWSPSCRENPKILGIANSFAGGVFLAIAFMHITPEMIETWNDLPSNEGKDPFPLPEALIFIGYTLILIIDKVLFDTHALFDHDHDDGEVNDPAVGKFDANVKASMVKAQAMQGETDPAALKASRIEEKENIEGAVKNLLNPNDRFATRMKASLSKGSRADVGNDANEQENLFVDSNNVLLNKADDPTKRAEDLAESMADIKKKSSCCPNMTPFILMIALSVHSVFEGLALGLQLNEGQVINIVIAILVHKGAAGSSLGISLVKTFPTNFRICRQMIVIFSLATPLGVVIGMLIANAGDIYDIIFSSIAAGSFVYIACSEVIVEEFSIPGNRWLKLLAFLFGAAIITCLWFLDA